MVLEPGIHRVRDVQVTVGGIEIHGGNLAYPNETILVCGSGVADTTALLNQKDPVGGLGHRCFSSSSDQLHEGNFIFLRALMGVTLVPAQPTGAVYSSYVQPPEEFGGALLISGVNQPIKMQNVVFSGFRATKHGGAVVVVDVDSKNKVSFIDSLFLGCLCTSINVAPLALVSKEPPSSVDQNEKEEGQYCYGGAISLVNSAAEFTNTVFDGNSATFGGAVSISSHTKLHPSASLQSVRGIFKNYRTEANMVKTEFHKNVAREDGGALYVSDATVSIEESRFGDSWSDSRQQCDRVERLWDKMTTLSVERMAHDVWILLPNSTYDLDEILLSTLNILNTNADNNANAEMINAQIDTFVGTTLWQTTTLVSSLSKFVTILPANIHQNEPQTSLHNTVDVIAQHIDDIQFFLTIRKNKRTELLSLIRPFQDNTTELIEPVVNSAEASGVLDNKIAEIIDSIEVVVDQLNLESRTIAYGYKCGSPVTRWHYFDDLEMKALANEDENIFISTGSKSDIGKEKNKLSVALSNLKSSIKLDKAEIESSLVNLHDSIKLESDFPNLVTNVNDFSKLLDKSGPGEFIDIGRSVDEDEQKIEETYIELQRLSYGFGLFVKAIRRYIEETKNVLTHMLPLTNELPVVGAKGSTVATVLKGFIRDYIDIDATTSEEQHAVLQTYHSVLDRIIETSAGVATMEQTLLTTAADPADFKSDYALWKVVVDLDSIAEAQGATVTQVNQNNSTTLGVLLNSVSNGSIGTNVIIKSKVGQYFDTTADLIIGNSTISVSSINDVAELNVSEAWFNWNFYFLQDSLQNLDRMYEEILDLSDQREVNTDLLIKIDKPNDICDVCQLMNTGCAVCVIDTSVNGKWKNYTNRTQIKANIRSLTTQIQNKLEKIYHLNVSCLAQQYPSDCIGSTKKVLITEQIAHRVGILTSLAIEVEAEEFKRLEQSNKVWVAIGAIQASAVERRRSLQLTSYLNYTDRGNGKGLDEDVEDPLRLLKLYFFANQYFYDQSYAKFRTEDVLSGTYNTAVKGDGGLVHIKGSNLKISTSVLENGLANWGSGGAVKSLSSSFVMIKSSVENCKSAFGGGISAIESKVEISSCGLNKNVAFRDGGALMLGENSETILIDTELKKNSIDCPIQMLDSIVKSCPADWGNSLAQAQSRSGYGVQVFCMHPICKNYLGRGGAIMIENSLRFEARKTKMFDNIARGGGGAIFAQDTLDFTVGGSTFENNAVKRMMDITGDPSFTAGGGALFFQLTYFHTLDFQPLLSTTKFINNEVVEGNGGAIYWSVPPSMFQQVRDAGADGLINFVGYSTAVSATTTTEPLASSNVAEWGGDFIASGPMSLVVLNGPAKNEGAVSTTEVTCEGISSTNVCPFHCSGAGIKKQQCVARTSTPSQAVPSNSWGGRQLTDVEGAQPLRVAIVDFYNHIFKTALEPVVVEASANFTALNLGPAWNYAQSTDSGKGTNCTQYSTAETSNICTFAISQVTTAENSNTLAESLAVSVIPENGIATFTGLAIHARPSNICYTKSKSTRSNTTVCTPSSIHLKITSPTSLGTDETAQPLTAVTIKNCEPGTYLDTRPLKMRCVNCPPGRYGNRVNLNINGGEVDGKLSCSACNVGKYQKESGQKSCTACGKGMFASDFGQASCRTCINGTDTREKTGQTQCFSCGIGFYGDIMGGESDSTSYATCKECPTGRFQAVSFEDSIFGGGNSATPVSTLVSTPSKKMWDCSHCPMGFFQPRLGNSTCINCPPGRTSIEGGTACDFACLKGTYRGSSTYPHVPWAQSYPKWMDYTITASIRNLTPKDMCVSCPQGFSSSGSTESTKDELINIFGKCDPCVPGRYQDEKGKAVCLDCKIGTETPNPGSSVCNTCVLGTYQNEIGKARCKECESGLFNSLQHVALDSTTCEICTLGEWTRGLHGDGRPSTEKNTALDTLPLPVHLTSTGWDTCQKCPTGRFGIRKKSSQIKFIMHQLIGDCSLCGPNFFSNSPGSTKCKKCPARSWTAFERGSETCTMCKQGEIYSNISHTLDCVSCRGVDPGVIGDRGMYSLVAGGDKCFQCPPGRRCDGGNQMSTEWGWWVSSGREMDKDTIRRRNTEQFKKNKAIPLNKKECSQYMMPDRAKSIDTNTTTYFDPVQCGDECNFDKDKSANNAPGCSCKTNKEGAEECKIFCEVKDSFAEGVYVDACGLPTKITRCPGFERRVSCEDEFKKQMKELLDPEQNRESIKLPSQCVACRANNVLRRHSATMPVTIVQHPFKRVVKAHDPKTGTDIVVDALWLFEGGLQHTDHSMHKVITKKTSGVKNGLPFFEQIWDLEILQYKMPRTGIWDVDTYGSARLSDYFKKKSEDAGGSLEFITVGLLANDPRLQYFNKLRGSNEIGSDNSMNSSDSIINTTELNLLNNSMHFVECNVMAGYHGRMCSSCLPGFSMKRNRCVRCSNYVASMTRVVFGAVLGFVLVTIMVLTVVSDAGSTSTASSLKRIVLNHMQILNMITNINLNWTPNTKEFFALAGAASSVGEEMIQTGCILNADIKSLAIRPFYLTQIVFVMMTLAVMTVSGLYWKIHEVGLTECIAICLCKSAAKVEARNKKRNKKEKHQRRTSYHRNVSKVELNSEEKAIHMRMHAREKAMFLHAFEGLLCHANAANVHSMSEEDKEVEHQCWLKISKRFETVVTMLEDFDPNTGGKTPLMQMKAITEMVDYPFLGHSPLEIATYPESGKRFESITMPDAIDRFNDALVVVSTTLVQNWMQTTDYSENEKMDQLELDDIRPLLVTAVRVNAAENDHEQFVLTELGTCSAHLDR